MQPLRYPEKGALAKGALRKFVANCAPNLRKIAGISFRTSEEGCAKLSQICREFESFCLFPRFLRARKVRRILGVLRFFLGICKKTKEKKDKELVPSSPSAYWKHLQGTFPKVRNTIRIFPPNKRTRFGNPPAYLLSISSSFGKRPWSYHPGTNLYMHLCFPGGTIFGNAHSYSYSYSF